MISHGTPNAPAATPSESAAEAVRTYWRSREVEGRTEYFDSSAEVWLPLDQAAVNLDARRRFRAVMGDTKYTAIANTYEKGRGL